MNQEQFHEILKKQNIDNTIMLLTELQNRMIIEDVSYVSINFMEHKDTIFPDGFVVDSKNDCPLVNLFAEEFHFELAKMAKNCDDSYHITQSHIELNIENKIVVSRLNNDITR